MKKLLVLFVILAVVISACDSSFFISPTNYNPTAVPATVTPNCPKSEYGLPVCGTSTPYVHTVYAGPGQYTISYSVTGTASSVDITYNNAQGGTEQKTVSIPWSGDTYIEQPGYFAYISAQNNGDSGSVTCTITVNHVPVKTSTSDGAYVIATCSGRL